MVRPAVRADVADIWALVKGLAAYERLSDKVTGSPEAMERWIFDEPVVSCLIKELECQVIGYAIFFRTFSTFRTQPGIWLEDIFVQPEHRGLGFGKELLETVIEVARTQGFGRVEWSVLDWNEPAIGFYESIGATVMPDWRICRIDLSR